MAAGIKYTSQVLNQRGAPALFEDILTNRPAATFEGRLFFATDVVSGDTIFRDNGDGTWTALAGNGGGGGVTGAFNGCQEQANEIGLGGQLSEATEIINDNFPISFFAGATSTPQFLVTNDAAVSELAAFTSLTPFNDGGVYIGNFETSGTIQAKENAGQTPTELRLNNSGGSILLGNINLGMYFDKLNSVIYTEFNGACGLSLDFNSGFYSLGDFDYTVNGTYLQVYDNNSEIKTFYSNSPNGLSFDFSNNIYSFGDFGGTNNSTYLSVNDDVQYILFNSNAGSYRFNNVPNFANNVTAIAGGLSVGDIYRVTGTGNMHIVF